MQNDTTLLISHLSARSTDISRATDGANIILPQVAPPATPPVIDRCQDALGFKLPQLLRQIYIEIANGGFGPGYGFIGCSGGTLDHGFNIVDIYSMFRQPRADDPVWQWPEKLLPICHLGCGMYACVDCDSPEGAIVWFEPNPREPEEPLDIFLIPVVWSLSQWLWMWLRDEDWMTAAYEKSILKKWQEKYST